MSYDILFYYTNREEPVTLTMASLQEAQEILNGIKELVDNSNKRFLSLQLGESGSVLIYPRKLDTVLVIPANGQEEPINTPPVEVVEEHINGES